MHLKFHTLAAVAAACLLLAVYVSTAGASASSLVLVDAKQRGLASRVNAHLATASSSGNEIVVAFGPANAADPASVTIKPAESGTWDLSAYDEVSFTLSNPGTRPVNVFCRVDNAWATTGYNRAIARATVDAGATIVIGVPFAGGSPWTPDDKMSGSQLSSDRVVGVSVLGDENSNGQTVIVRKIVAEVIPPPAMPAWLGKRPPVAGNWMQTLNENFDGTTLDSKVWAVPDKPEESIWDSVSVNRAANAYLENGFLKIKCDRIASGDQYSEPQLASRKYATSVVTTFDKWHQRYGYIEARMKLPTALGMWPGFWLMPDRGPGGGDYWKRIDTVDGGMEFDVMEYLARFGPFHYNIAMHWDGYFAHHKTIANENTYCQPDKDGFITSGLLWEPGKATFYCNGSVVGSWVNPRVGVVPSHILFTMPLGGWGTNGFVEDAKLPDTFQIDYVRAWQRDDLAALPPYDLKAPVPVPTPN